MRRIRAILTVFKKEFTMLVRYPTWMISMFIWPLIFPLLYILSAMGYAGPDKSGLATFVAATGTNNYVEYIIIGTMAWMWVNSIMWTFGTYLRNEQMLGTLESNWLCPINKIDFLLGAALMSVLMGMIINCVSIVEYSLIYRAKFTGNIFSWIIVYLIMLPGVYGISTLFASLVLWAKETNAAVQIVRGIMMMLCGITFPIAITPQWMQVIAKGIPFTYGIEAARSIMVFGNGISGSIDVIVKALLIGIVYVVLGRAAFAYTERKVKMQGSLGRY